MITLALRGVALTGVGALLILPDTPESIAMYGILITSIAGLVKQIIDKRSERQDKLDAHRFALEDRAAADASRNSMQYFAAETKQALAENTAITRETGSKLDQAADSVNANIAAVGERADVAFATANHINEKIAGIATAALSLDRGTALRDAASARADTACIREAIAQIGDKDR